MLLLVFFVLINCSKAHFPLSTFESYLEKNGLPRGSISQSELNQLLIRIEKAAESDNLENIGQSEFSLSISSNISFATTLWDILGTISGVVYWITVFEKEVADAISSAQKSLAAANGLKSSFRSKKKYEQIVLRYRGDLKKVHLNYKKALTIEARRILSPAEMIDFKKRIRRLEEQESSNLEMVYAITGSGKNKRRRSGIA